MKIQDRSYSSKVFRPKPHVHMEADGSLLVVATSWGQPEHAAIVADEIVKYVTAARGDVEVTSPFEFKTCLSDEANHLRIGTLIANDVLYRGENKGEYVSGIEILALSRRGRQVAWVQAGAPHLLLRRAGKAIVPIATSFDYSFECLSESPILSPLPSRLLGVDPTCNLSCGDFQAGAHDMMVLLASSNLPQAMWTDAGPIDLQGLTRKMVQEDADSPFWMALVDFTDEL